MVDSARGTVQVPGRPERRLVIEALADLPTAERVALAMAFYRAQNAESIGAELALDASDVLAALHDAAHRMCAHIER